MPVVRAPYDLSALSTSLVTRTGAPGGGNAEDLNTYETYVNGLESQVADLRGALDDANGNWAAVAKERDALLEKVADKDSALSRTKTRLINCERALAVCEKRLNAAYKEYTDDDNATEDEAGNPVPPPFVPPSDDLDDAPLEQPPAAQPQAGPSEAPGAYVDGGGNSRSASDAEMDDESEALQRRIHMLLERAREMEADLKKEGLYAEHQDLYNLTIPSVREKLLDRHWEQYPGMARILADEVGEAWNALKAQQEFNEAEGINSDGEKVPRRKGARGKGRARR